MEQKDFWNQTGKVLIIVALLIGAINLVMNFTRICLEEQYHNGTASSQVRSEEQVSVINVLAAGDAEFGYYTNNQEEYWENVSSIAEIVANYDVAVYNQKAMIGSEVPWQFGEALLGTGFHYVGLANAEAFRYGKEGIDRSMDYWDGTEALTSGTHTSTDTQNLIPMRRIEDISVAFLSYTESLHEELPEQEQYLVNIYEEVTTISQIEKAAQQADVVIVSIDWDAVDGEQPSQKQKEMAKAMADAGASIIIGHCDNAIQPVAWIDDTLVFYSTGALISDALGEQERLGILGSITITKTTVEDKKRVELTNPRVEIITSKPSQETYHIELLEKGSLYDSCVEVIQMMDDSIRIGGLW